MYGNFRHRTHAVKKIVRHMLHPQSKKITDLRAGNQNRDSVRESRHTDRGKYRTIAPSPVNPSTTTTNASVGRPICVFDPPNAEIRNPVTIAQ